MSIFHRDFVIFASEAMGLSDLNEEVVTALTQDMEYRLREIIQVTFVILLVKK
ncbi:hypothetical protein HMI56_004662 [Coelomomyces lativittatus]|nr:hypothetical protein HMI56_004662 [Coelomomyces lativittatus]